MLLSELLMHHPCEQQQPLFCVNCINPFETATPGGMNGNEAICLLPACSFCFCTFFAKTPPLVCVSRARRRRIGLCAGEYCKNKRGRSVWIFHRDSRQRERAFMYALIEGDERGERVCLSLRAIFLFVWFATSNVGNDYGLWRQRLYILWQVTKISSCQRKDSNLLFQTILLALPL
jgi:hypothetical protein